MMSNNSKKTIIKTADGKYYLQTNGTLRQCTLNDGKLLVGGIASANIVRSLTRAVTPTTSSSSPNVGVIRPQVHSSPRPPKVQGQIPVQGRQLVLQAQSVKGGQKGRESQKGGVAPKSPITPSHQAPRIMPSLQGCGDSDKNEGSNPGEIGTGQITSPTASLTVGQEYNLNFPIGTTPTATWDGSNFILRGNVPARRDTPRLNEKGDSGAQQVQGKVIKTLKDVTGQNLSPKQVTSNTPQGRSLLHSLNNEQWSRPLQPEPTQDRRQVAVEGNSNEKGKPPVQQQPSLTPGVKRVWKPTEEGKYAVWANCGQLSSNYNICGGCHQLIPEEPRYYKPDHSKRPRLEEAGNSQQNAVFPRTANNHVSTPSTQPLYRKSYGDQSGQVITPTVTPPIRDTTREEKPLYVKLDSWSIRIGSLKGLPYEKVGISHLGIDIKMEYGEETLVLRIGCDEIVKVIAHFGPNLPLLFIYTSPQCAARIRSLCNMTTWDKSYFDPTSNDATHRRITILMDNITQEQVHQIREVCRQIQEKPGLAIHQLLREVESDEAKTLLTLSTSTIRSASGASSLVTEPEWSDEEDADYTNYDWSEWKDAYENVHNSPVLPTSPNLATSQPKTDGEPIDGKGSNNRPTPKHIASDPLTTTPRTDTNAEVKESAISGSSTGQPSPGELASYVKEIRTTYKGSPHIVSGFLCLLRDFISKRISRDILVNQSRALFHENPHLVKGLLLFKSRETDQLSEEGQPNECTEQEDEGIEEKGRDHPASPAIPIRESVQNDKALDAEVADIMNQSRITNSEMPLQLQRICKRIQGEMEEVDQMGYTLVTLVAKRDSAPTMLGFPTGVYTLGDDKDAFPSLMKILRRT